MIRSLTIAAVLALTPFCAFAQSPAPAPAPAPASAPVDAAGAYAMDRTHASLTWKVPHLGLSNYTARFTKFDATLTIDPAKPEGGKLSVTIDPTSIRTDYPFAERKDFDKELSEDARFFNTSKFPALTFTSTKIERTGEKTANVTGDLTLLGVTKPIVIAVTLNGAREHPAMKKPALGFSGVAKVKRTDFGMMALVPAVGEEVTLLIEAEFVKS